MARQAAMRSKASIDRRNRVLGRKLVDRIEKVIIDTDRTFFNLVNIDNPREFIELWRRIIRVSPAVETVAVLDERRRLRHFLAKLRPGQRRRFRRVFQRKILPEMRLDRLNYNKHKHLHTHHREKPYLLSYIRRRSADGDYFVVLSINIAHVTGDIFPAAFGQLRESRSISVIDEEGSIIYGQPPLSGPSARLVFEQRFPTTLYKWRLQVATPDVQASDNAARTRRLVDLILVGIALGIIVVGMLILGVAVRKERRANQLKSEFIANVSHELKTPLSLIRMFGELLAYGERKPDVTHEYAQIITRESDRLTALIDNVLDFARTERGKVSYEFRNVNLEAIITRVAELYAHRVAQQKTDLIIDIEPDLPPVSVDESAITLLLLNLVENALKYGCPEGNGKIHISLKRQAQAIVLRVSDDGPGITADDQRRVFERFYRGRRAPEQPTVRGSGIGLSLVKQIAEAHGGKVRLTSQPNTGTTFDITLPLPST